MTDLRKCIGSAKFGIAAHEAPVADFPAQPSQKDGLGRMCKPHWNAYTTALRKAALARKAADGETPAKVAPAEPKPDAEAGQARSQGDRARRLVRRATPDRPATPLRTFRPRAPTRGRSPFDRVLDHARGHRATWANVGAQGPSPPDPLITDRANARNSTASAARGLPSQQGTARFNGREPWAYRATWCGSCATRTSKRVRVMWPCGSTSFGIEHAERLDGVNRKELCALAGISENWATEIHKGMRLADYVTLR